MSAPRINAATANAMLDSGIGSRADGGVLQIYDGTQPASGGGAVTTQTKLAEFALAGDAFAAASAGVLTAGVIGSTVGLATGTATWFRLLGAGGVHLLDGDVGEAASGADCILTETDITAVDVLAVVSLTITMPLQ